MPQTYPDHPVLRDPKIQAILEQEYGRMSDAEFARRKQALTQIMAQLETLCAQDNANEVVSLLLKQFDVVTGLSAWSDPTHTH